MPLRARSWVRSTSRLMARTASSAREPRRGSSLPSPARARPARDEASGARVAPPPAERGACGCPRATGAPRRAGPRRADLPRGAVTARTALWSRWAATWKSDELVSDRSGGPTCRSTPSKAFRHAGESVTATTSPRAGSWREERADEAVGEGAPGARSAVRSCTKRGRSARSTVRAFRHAELVAWLGRTEEVGDRRGRTRRGVVQEVVAPALDDVQTRVGQVGRQHRRVRNGHQVVVGARTPPTSAG